MNQRLFIIITGLLCLLAACSQGTKEEELAARCKCRTALGDASVGDVWVYCGQKGCPESFSTHFKPVNKWSPDRHTEYKGMRRTEAGNDVVTWTGCKSYAPHVDCVEIFCKAAGCGLKPDKKKPEKK